MHHAIRHRGVAYDTGTPFETFQGELSRNVWGPELMQAEIGLVSEELHGNSVNVYGSELDRLSDTAHEAAERGLHVWLDPRFPDHTTDEAIEHLAEVARLAESLRREGVDIDLTVGATHTILTHGILGGDHDSYLWRIAGLFFDGDMRFGVRVGKPFTPAVVASLTESAPRLNAFLARAASVARGIFHGRLAYFAAPWEQVDWAPLDFVGIMYFLTPTYLTPEQHLAQLATFARHGRPVLISGFGTASYKGADEKGFFSWDVIDRGSATPTVLDGYVRDEGAQAAYYQKMLGLFERAGVYGVAPADLVHPTHPYSTDPRLDLDIASMCIVRSVRDDYADPNSPYRREPKESFRAVAEFYDEARRRQRNS